MQDLLTTPSHHAVEGSSDGNAQQDQLVSIDSKMFQRSASPPQGLASELRGVRSAAGTDRQRLPPGTWWLVGAIAILFSWGPNFELLVLSVTVLVIGSALCWRPGEPAVILFLFGYQWLQASIGIFVANVADEPIQEMAALSNPDMPGATALTLVGLLFLFAFLRLAAGAPFTSLATLARQQAKTLAPSRLWIIYLTSALAALAFTYASGFAEGFRQPLLAFANVKWAAFVIVAYAAFVQGGRAVNLFVVIFAVELIFSLGGYFSSFQQVFVYTFIALIGANVRLSAARAGALMLLVVMAIALAVIWTAIKADYRAYLNAGSGQQVITVNWTDRTTKLLDMATSVTGEQLQQGAVALVARLTYVEFFGAAMNFVPAIRPHTDGAIWGEALLHPLTPRFLFPNKPITDDSAQVREYTGVQVAGWNEGTQISIGYFGESYIDFGAVGMMFPLALYGLAAGAMYRSVLRFRHFHGLIGAAFAVPLIMGGSHIGVSTEKLVGGLVATYLAFFLLHQFTGRAIRKLVHVGAVAR